MEKKLNSFILILFIIIFNYFSLFLSLSFLMESRITWVDEGLCEVICGIIY